MDSDTDSGLVDSNLGLDSKPLDLDLYTDSSRLDWTTDGAIGIPNYVRLRAEHWSGAGAERSAAQRSMPFFVSRSPLRSRSESF